MPVLKLKRAEKASLGLLAETITTHVTPLLEIVEMPKGTPSGKSKALERHLTNAFRRLKEGDIPGGTTGLSKDAVMSYAAELYTLDGQISYGREKLFAR